MEKIFYTIADSIGGDSSKIHYFAKEDAASAFAGLIEKKVKEGYEEMNLLIEDYDHPDGVWSAVEDKRFVFFDSLDDYMDGLEEREMAFGEYAAMKKTEFYFVDGGHGRHNYRIEVGRLVMDEDSFEIEM